MQLPDPFMPDQPKKARNYFIACYTVSLIQDQTILGSPIHHQIVVNYLTAAHQLLRSWKLQLNSKEDYTKITLAVLKNYGCIPNRQNMITDSMVS